jgi:hypothetical protein
MAMIKVCRRISHDYPNRALVAVGIALVALPELHSKAVIHTYVGLHHQSWPPIPVVARVVDLWWAAEHTVPFMIAAISATIIGAIMVLFGAFRGIRQWVA